MPVGQVVPIRDAGVRRELLLVAYLQSADGARFTMASRPFRRLTAVDDHGASYQLGFRGGHAAAELVLRPDPPHQIRWLDLITAPGEPATRIDLDPQIPAPDVTVTRKAHSPGELLLDVIAARILCSGAAVPRDDLEHPPAGAADLRAFIGDGGQRPGVVPGTVGHGAEIRAAMIQQELTRAACVRGHGDIGVRDLPAQIDAGGGFDGAGDVKPADLVRRVGAQQQLACCMPAAPADLVADAAVICCRERGEGPADHDEPRAARGLQVGHEQATRRGGRRCRS